MKCPEIYLCISETLGKAADRDKTLPREKVMGLLGIVYKIPKAYKHKVIQDLIKHGLIKPINKFKIQIKG